MRRIEASQSLMIPSRPMALRVATWALVITVVCSKNFARVTAAVATAVLCTALLTTLVSGRQTAALAPGTITTIAGPPVPADGEAALAHGIDGLFDVTSDGTGGFYYCSGLRIYHANQRGVLRAVAGSGIYGFTGDTGSALAARFRNPTCQLAVDAAGNLYVADTGNARVRMVTPDGSIRTIAGDGTFNAGGDNGPASRARLHPAGIVVDRSGTLFIGGNARIRRIGVDGIITTVAGTGVDGFSGDGGAASAAQISNGHLAIDRAGNLYLASDSRVRRIGTDGIITSVAGTGVRGFSGDGGPAIAAQVAPLDVAVDARGEIYIADSNSHRVRKVSSAGIITTIAGTGEEDALLTGAPVGEIGDGRAATDARLNGPLGLDFDNEGDLLIADRHHVRRVTPDGIIGTVAGNGSRGFRGDGGPATRALLYSPRGVAVDRRGQIYIADANNGRVRMITPDGVIRTIAGTGPPPMRVSRPPENTELFRPESVAVDGQGLLYVADSRAIRTVARDGTVRVLRLRTDTGDNGVAGPMAPRDVATGPDEALFIADDIGNRILRVSRDGTLTLVAGGGTSTGDGIPATSAQVRQPKSVAADTEGAVYFVEEGGRLRKVSTDGRLTTLLTRVGLADIAVMNRDLYLVTSTSGRVSQLMADGSERCVAGGCVIEAGLGFSGDGGPATEAQLGLPQAIAIDAQGNLFIAEASGNRIRKVSTMPQAEAIRPVTR